MQIIKQNGNCCFLSLFKLKDIKTMKLYCSSHEDVIARIGELLSLIIYFELLN